MPKTYLIGETQIDWVELAQYLQDTGQEDFMDELKVELPQAVQLSSFYAKLCYKSLVIGRNNNITRTRAIEQNFKGIIKSGHGSVLEHYNFNFITTGCSRVFTHELVRHRVGTAFSQTSGRYCTIDQDSELVIDPILDPCKGQIETIWGVMKENIDYLYDQLGLNGIDKCWNSVMLEQPPWEDLTAHEQVTVRQFGQERGFEFAQGHDPFKASSWTMPFSLKKKITSACRRLAPNGQSNEIGWSCNLRSLRHMIEMRTSPHAEWEIRKVFMDVAEMLDPLLLHGGTQRPDGSWMGLRL